MAEIDLNYLNNERLEAFKRIQGLEQSFSNLNATLAEVRSIAESKITTTEAEAKQILINAKDTAKNAKEKSDEVIQLVSDVQNVVNSYKTNKTLFNNALKKVEELESYSTQLSENIDKLTKQQSELENLQGQVANALTSAQQSKTQIKSIETETSTSFAKITDLQNKSAEFKGKIEELFNEIIGYDTEDGKHEAGLKEELEQAYNALSKSIKESKEYLENLKRSYDNTFEEKKKRIEELLPDALTTGLASAYTTKKDKELDDLIQYKKSFKYSIFGLVGISCIPLIVNSVLYFKYNYSLPQIFASLPTSLAFVLPLYLPVLWLAWNANKELKLSKRLIEEYSHKEVMSRTYQGLVQQVKELDSDDVSCQLKDRLLYNLISVNSENPGKLISDYDKTDNPLIELLDRSIALSNVFEKIKDFPGLGKLSVYFENKEKENLKKVTEKANEGLNIQRDLQE